MTGFSVDPATVRGLAAQVDRASTDVDDTKTYLKKMATLDGDGGEGLLNVCVDSHRMAYQALSDWLGTLSGTTLADTAAAVTASADYYEKTDAGAAAQLDATYPPSDVDKARAQTDIPVHGEGSGPFSGDTRPALEDPHDYHELMYGGLPNWWDVMSPMAWAGTLIEGVTHVAVWLGLMQEVFNPQQQIAKNFIGDWPAVRAAADVLREVSKAADEVANSLRIAGLDTDREWDGNAGDGATVYLLTLAETVDSARPPIDKLADAYEQAATDMQTLRDAVVGVVEFMGDSALMATVGIYVAQNLYATGVGGPLAALLTAYAGFYLVEVANGATAAIDIASKLALATNLLKAEHEDFAGVGTVSLPKLPTSPFAVPGR